MEVAMEGKQLVEEEGKPRVDLNRATAEELESISGIGPALAQRILDYRQAKGAFLSTDEILAIPGIGPVLYDRISERLIVTPPEGEIEEEAVLIPEEMEVEEEAALTPEEAEVEEIPTAPSAELEAPSPVVEEAEAAPPPPTPPAAEPYRWGKLSWLWSAILGGLLGVIGTLLILSIINGSVNLGHAPVILDLDNRLQALATDMESRVQVLTTDIEGLQGEVQEMQQRLEVLEGLPARMDAVEETVHELNQDVEALNERMDAVQEELAVVQTHAEKVETFFQRLQSLLFDVFGMELPEPSSSGQ